VHKEIFEELNMTLKKHKEKRMRSNWRKRRRHKPNAETRRTKRRKRQR
jgi:hypothetical protein